MRSRPPAPPTAWGPANALDYEDADDLMGKLEALSPAAERELQEGALTWASDNTTRAVATRFLRALGYGAAVPERQH